jgi:hypothetical protein
MNARSVICKREPLLLLLRSTTRRTVLLTASRVGPRCIGAPRGHAQHLCRRVLAVACPGFLAKLRRIEGSGKVPPRLGLRPQRMSAEPRRTREAVYAGKPEAFRTAGGRAAFPATLTRPYDVGALC